MASTGTVRIIRRGPPGFGAEPGTKGEIVVKADGTWEIEPNARNALLARSNQLGQQGMETVQGLDTALAAKAALESPALTGTPTAPTPPGGNASTRVATTSFVATEVAALVAQTPGAQAALQALADLFQADPFMASSVVNSIATKADKTQPIAGTGLAVASGTLGTSPAVNVPQATPAEVAAATSDSAAVTPLALAGQPLLSADFSFVRTDAAGRVLEAVGLDGSYISGLYTHRQTLGRAVAGFYDEAGGVVYERDRFGVDLEAAEYDAWIANGQIWAEVAGDVIQITAGPATYAKAEIRAGRMVVVRADGRRFVSPLSGSFPALDAGTDTIEYSDMYGQSNGAGSANGAVVNGTALNSRFLMFAGGQHAFADALGQNRGRYQLLQAVPDAIHDVVQGFEQISGNSGETPNSGFAHAVLTDNTIGTTVSLLTTCSAIGSANQEMLWKDATENTDPTKNATGDPWRRLEEKFVRAALFWRLQGFSFIAGPLRHNQGEGNYNRTKANHLAGLVTFRDDWQALALAWNALRASGGFPGKAPLIVTQMVNGNFYALPASEVPWAQLQINLDDATTALCAGPNYDQAHLGDGVHLTAAGQEMQGARQGVAYAEWLKGNMWYPLHVRKDSGFQPVRTGTTVRLRIRNHFNLPLVFDTAAITGLGAAQGFAWKDDGNGNAVSVTNAVIVDATTVDLTLSAIPTGTNGMIDIAMAGGSGLSAGPVTGNRSSLRTNGSGVTTRGGRAVEHFICIDRVAVV